MSTKHPINMDNQKKIDESFMREALAQAEKSRVSGDWPIGCVIVIDNKVVSTGRNQGYSHHNRLHHAEIDAMSKIKEVLELSGEKATVYVTFEPCPMCVGALLLNHVHRLVYGPNLDNSGGLHLLKHKPKRYSTKKYDIELVPGVLADECEKIFLSGEPTQKIKTMIKKN